MSQAPAMPVFCDALIGDTTHLSATEFGAYCLILFVTWRNNGSPLPDDDKRLARVCRLSRGQWLKVRPALVGFFDISDGNWRQKRLEKEWFYVAKKIAANRENGKYGGRPKSLENNDDDKANGYGWVNPDESESKAPIPNPITSKKEPPVSPPGGRVRGSRLSSDWVLEPEQRDYATSRGLDPDRLAEDFRAYWLAKAGSGACKVDWNLMWQTWVRREADRKPSPPALAKQPAPSASGGVADSEKVAALVRQSFRWVQTPEGMKRERVA